MPIFDGEMKKAQLEEIASTNPSPTARSRIYSDKTDTSRCLPKFYNGTKWVELLTSSAKIATVTSNGALSETADIHLLDSTSAALDVTLYSAAAYSGRIIRLKRTNAIAASKAITITPDGAETIEGGTDFILMTQGESVDLLSDGTNWRIVGRVIPSNWIAMTVTGSWVANTTYTAKFRRVGDSIDYFILVTLAGAPTAASLTITFPSYLAINTTKIGSTSTSGRLQGTVALLDSGTDNYSGYIYYSSSTTIAIYKDDGDATVSVVNATAPYTFANNDAIFIRGSGLPIEYFYDYS